MNKYEAIDSVINQIDFAQCEKMLNGHLSSKSSYKISSHHVAQCCRNALKKAIDSECRNFQQHIGSGVHHNAFAMAVYKNDNISVDIIIACGSAKVDQ